MSSGGNVDTTFELPDNVMRLSIGHCTQVWWPVRVYQRTWRCSIQRASHRAGPSVMAVS